ncbi:MocR-like pyridoxine biosynthesis transcription factor PdxR [Actinomadura macrotermitis]|uniref:HTH-type transcriptional regulatory protein GabR n=1 Tax=Actinomadura macrotermitis TaxID=2585200 RepID=A0A7K0BRT5_9ACTN|nr:PLP-dependent aminotransferase family protein [Actinomadura macrotermitis]MQY03910.1 HTH-type transcriptional regulatory protein GabR [Actinomadura macrotermitis]
MPDLHLPLDRAAGRLAAQVAAGLRAGIRAGRLTAGTRLPSSRDLARDLAVSRGVAVAAYEQLIAEGFLTARRGDGTRVAPMACPDEPAPPRPAVWPCEPAAPAATVFDLRPGQPDLTAFPRERWLAALRAVLRGGAHDDLFAYPDPGGAPALRAELAGYLGRVRAADVTADRVVIVNGVAQGLSAVVRLLRADGHDVLAVEDPTSVRQLPMLRATGVRLARVPVDGEGLDVAALARSGARAVLVTPAHQYPTGVVLSPARRAALVAWARETGGIVLEDDYDAEFRYDRDPVGCLQGIDPDRVVLLGSVSKSLSPALRLGWAVAPARLAGLLREHRARTDLGAPVLEQHALAHLIADGGYDRHLRTMRRRYRARRDALAAGLAAHAPAAKVHGVSAGMHLYVELPAGCDEDDTVAAAARAGVAVAAAGPMWAGRAAPALVLGYGRVGEGRMGEAARVLAGVITQRARG